ncbi:MAG: hypothetical protein ACR2IK_18575 [Chloroflexota bacterium]
MLVVDAGCNFSALSTLIMGLETMVSLNAPYSRRSGVHSRFVGDELARSRPHMVEQWGCLFEGRAGAKARAVFATEEHAKQFAERHAQVTATGMPLKWNDANDRLVLTTPIGCYRIVQIDED